MFTFFECKQERGVNLSCLIKAYKCSYLSDILEGLISLHRLDLILLLTSSIFNNNSSTKFKEV